MRHRPGVTLIEVLVTIFIMGIGMLALLTLFPVGAISMARALVNDRAAQAANNADAFALVQDIRHDPLVISDATVVDAFANPFSLAPFGNPPFNTPLSTTISGPSHGVFVDPWGFLLDPNKSIGAFPALPAVSTTTPGMRRRSISLFNILPPTGLALTLPQCGRWRSLTDDLYWSTPNNATADLSAGTVHRGLAYTWAWHLRRPRAYDPSVVDMSIVIYRGRSTTVLGGETTYPVSAGGAVGTNSLTINWAALPQPNVRLGRWILDISPNNVAPLAPNSNPIPNGAVPGYFYRIVDYADLGGNLLQLELETNLKQSVNTVVVMEDVAEVIDKGSNWLP